MKRYRVYREVEESLDIEAESEEEAVERSLAVPLEEWDAEVLTHYALPLAGVSPTALEAILEEAILEEPILEEDEEDHATHAYAGL